MWQPELTCTIAFISYSSRMSSESGPYTDRQLCDSYCSIRRVVEGSTELIKSDFNLCIKKIALGLMRCVALHS